MRSSFITVFFFILPWCLFGQQGADPRSMLITVSETDTVNAPDPVDPSDIPGSIKFANAFRWNRTGPTGGYWNGDFADDYVFRPVYTNVSSYKLEIFNRRGYLIYESTDLHKGWDGYLKNGSLASQGVYIWKVSGKYGDGSSFSRAGDVTFIY